MIPKNEQKERKIVVGVPLARLIKRRLVNAPELVMLNNTRSVAAEQYRRLKTVLTNHEQETQVIVVSSASPGEGKSVTSINLALAFASELDGEVLLVDADLRRATVDRWLSPEPKLGFSEILTQQTELDHALLDLKNSPLKILPAGSPPHDPVELLSSQVAGQVVEKLRGRFRRIIIDTPPVIPFTDADAVGAFCDGLVLVVRSRKTSQNLFTQAVESITSLPLLGTVLNDVTFNLADQDSYRYYQKNYYQYYDRDRER